MSIIQDFIALVQAGSKPAWVAFICSLTFLVLDFFGWTQLTEGLEVERPILEVTFVGSFSLLCVNLVPKALSLHKSVRDKKKNKAQLIEAVGALPEQEKVILSYLITSGTQVFTASIYNNILVKLQVKGVIVRCGGWHDETEWPFRVHDVVWHYLLENKTDFYVNIGEYDVPPYVERRRTDI